MNSPEIIKKSGKKIWLKWSIAFKLIPIIILVTGFKFIAHRYGWEVMDLNALFTSLVAGTIFLIGFLISGVLSDYKESEKIPSELAACLKTLLDDAYTLYKSKDSKASQQFIDYHKTFLKSLMLWFYRKERTQAMLDKISGMNQFFIDMEKEGITPAYIIKMKNDQSALRRMIMRIDTIRATDFVSSAYAIVEAMGFIIVSGLVIIKIEPFYASIFFTLIVTFLISYMFLLIKDMDNPFDYATNGESGTEVSLKPLHDLEKEFENFNYNN